MMSKQNMCKIYIGSRSSTCGDVIRNVLVTEYTRTCKLKQFSVLFELTLNPHTLLFDAQCPGEMSCIT